MTLPQGEAVFDDRMTAINITAVVRCRQSTLNNLRRYYKWTRRHYLAAGRQRPLDMAGAVAGQHAAWTPGHCLTAGGRLPLAMAGAVPWQRIPWSLDLSMSVQDCPGRFYCERFQNSELVEDFANFALQ